ncbi:MAG: sulfite exporter TauE/SafE family protein [Candidatus Competibacteraceae bacterium]|nr:sulfite exporter TauE/SafE family protein [Candidatus Competibacteraceae bacterium]
MISDPAFYLAAVPAVLIVGISKGGFGGGLGVVAVPLLSLAIDPLRAAAIMLPILCLMDLFSVWAYRRRWDPVNLRILLPAALAGIALAAATFRLVDATFVRLLVGGIAVGFALDYWLKGRRKRGGSRGPDPLKGGFWGAIAGFTSFIAHAAGPPLGVYLLPQRLEKGLFVGTTVIFFTVINYVKLVPYAWLGQLEVANLTTSLVLAPLAPLGVWLGVWLHGRIDENLFYRFCYLLVFMVGLKLLWEAFGALAGGGG